MRMDEFNQSIKTQENCPPSLPKALQALWHAKKGDWDKAHQIVQAASDTDSGWVHAYLHREEGDIGNARYWYRRTGRPEFKAALDQEWQEIATTLLQAL